MKRRLITMLLALSIFSGLTAFPSGVLAADESNPFEGYGAGFRGTDEPFDPYETCHAYSSLNSTEKMIYRFLKERFLQVAKGNLDSSVFEMNTAGQGIYATKNSIIGVDTVKIIDAVTMDFPCEAYWFDKTKGCICNWNYDLNTGVMKTFTISCPVLFEFARLFPNGERYYTYGPDPNKTRPVANIILKVQNVIHRYSELPDYEKLLAYRDYICGEVEYNYDAVETVNTENFFYAKPWQFIYVFDQDPATNVVCEGYSKAFKYLCDQSSFTNDVRCYLATGYLNGEAHMWNLVRINGKSYMADITVCDSQWGQSGGADDLFLAGAAGATGDGFTVQCFAHIHPVTGEYIPARSVSYTYWDQTKNAYDSKILTLESAGLGPSDLSSPAASKAAPKP